MTGTEIIVIVLCLPLGYWIVAVFLPSLFETDAVLADGSVAPEASEAASETAPSDSAPWFEVLGVPEASLREDIVVAHRRKIRQYHPDRVAQMGHEFRELAERRSKQINAAYATALKLRSGTCQA